MSPTEILERLKLQFTKVAGNDAEHIEFEISEMGGRYRVLPKNLFTLLLVHGVYMPFETAKTKKYVKTPRGIFSFTEEGPRRRLDWLSPPETVDMVIEKVKK